MRLRLSNISETEKCHFWKTWEYWAWFSRIMASLIVAFHYPNPVNYKIGLMEDQNSEIQELMFFLHVRFALSILNATPTRLGVCCNDCWCHVSWWNIYHCHHLYIAIHKMKHMFHGSEHIVSFSGHEHQLVLHCLRVSSSICNMRFLFRHRMSSIGASSVQDL